MEIYNEAMELIENPDLMRGYLEDRTRTVHHDAVEGVTEVWHYEVIAEYLGGGKDVCKVIDVPGVQAQEAWDEKIPIQIFIPYTQEKLDRMEAESSRPTQEERIKQMEITTDDIILMMAELIGGE